MLYSKPYINFINGRYFAEGLRMTAGIALPAFIFGYFNMLNIGIVFSTGALCVSITDSAGPVHHRQRGMFLCTLFIALVAMVTYNCLYNPIFLAIEIVLLGFACSMLNVYNARVSSVGLSGLLIMVLCMQTPLKGATIYIHTLYLIIGGLWYLGFSILLHTLKPYKIIQQLSAEFIINVAEYLKTRASFYDDHPNYDETYKALLLQQVNIQTQQTALMELLFKTRAITKNSTKAGRSLLKIYIDVSDLFESIMSTYQQYEVLHKRFDETGILDEYRKQLLLLVNELNDIAIAVGSGAASSSSNSNIENLDIVKQKFEDLRLHFLTETNVHDFIGLGRILQNIKGLTEKINALHYYTRYEKLKKAETDTGLDLQQFNEAQNIDATLFLNNLNLKSNVFRHSLRVAASLLVGYLISLQFNLGHSYWILLTIVVILKPAYSLTKTRNIDRLIGTLLGLVLGVIILFLVKNEFVLMAIMVVLMAGCYMFIRTKYFLSVLLMTPYLVLFFHLIYPGNIKVLLTDRLIDTAIGSGIAFLSSLFLVPAWEHTTIKNYMVKMLETNIDYFTMLSTHFTNTALPTKEQIKKARQQSLTALANGSDALNRMLSEPKRFQKNTEIIYRFVVLNQIITSHFSALAFYINEQKNNFTTIDLQFSINNTIFNLQNSSNILIDTALLLDKFKDENYPSLSNQTQYLLQQRKAEIVAGNLETETKKKLIETKSITDQFTYINNIATDIFKNTTAIVKGNIA